MPRTYDCAHKQTHTHKHTCTHAHTCIHAHTCRSSHNTYTRTHSHAHTQSHSYAPTSTRHTYAAKHAHTHARPRVQTHSLMYTRSHRPTSAVSGEVAIYGNWLSARVDGVYPVACCAAMLNLCTVRWQRIVFKT